MSDVGLEEQIQRNNDHHQNADLAELLTR